MNDRKYSKFDNQKSLKKQPIVNKKYYTFLLLNLIIDVTISVVDIIWIAAIKVSFKFINRNLAVEFILQYSIFNLTAFTVQTNGTANMDGKKLFKKYILYKWAILNKKLLNKDSCRY